jgi:hypothetical protein
MSPGAVEQRVRDLAARIPLPQEDWDAIAVEARQTLAVIAALDELSLHAVVPDPVSDAAETGGD